MTQSILYVPAANLTKSPSNVRKCGDAVADAQLEANIAARGVLQNLIGVPVARRKGQYRITAGGRRLDAVHRLIEKGTFAADYPVPVMTVGNAGDAIEISLSENFFRLGMNPADACRAFQDIIETEAKTPAEIATRFGLTERFVLGRLRLAGLAEPVFEALRDGTITLDVAKAYASTSDTARQAAVFEQLKGAYYSATVNEIRRALAHGSCTGQDPKALFVGRAAYIEAGGRIDGDLFSDADSEVWRDGDLLDRLADEKLAAAATAIRARDGYAEIRTVAASHLPYMETWGLREIEREPGPLGHEAEARKAEIEAELAGIETLAAGAGGYSGEQNDRIEVLEEELGAILDDSTVITAAQKATALAYVTIGADGRPQIHERLFVAPAAGVEDAPGRDGNGEERAAAAKVPKPVHSQRLADELAMMKTELLALHVAGDPHFALDLGTFIMVDCATRFGAADMPSALRASAPAALVQDFASGTSAAEAWAKLVAGLDRGWTDHAGLDARYEAFCALDEAARAAWLCWAVARTLHAVPAGRTGSGFLDHLGRKLGIDVAGWWRPTARNYFDRVTKPAILDLLEEIGGADLRARYAASKKHDLAASAEKLFAGQTIVEAELKERALAWLPEAMRFDPAGSAPTDAPGDADCGDSAAPADEATGSADETGATGAEESAAEPGKIAAGPAADGAKPDGLAEAA
ncbi:ParB/RepB/Spo0J family partition protein [Sphingomonas hylomeconis]|uniref:ParB/RepB/Spo0J family partition protein n=1 Tax=Sphingomonas hylomeconis TaxID=1395958 RepID=A0ABV7SQI5_9SPHN|nr:ParB/Srx family N-terminal domain-containing protein [Sphingomonas hylomeconis]